MTTSRSHDDLGSLAQMQADCRAASARLEQAAQRATTPAPSLHFDEQPAERAKPTIEVSEATRRLAAALHFHLE